MKNMSSLPFNVVQLTKKVCSCDTKNLLTNVKSFIRKEEQTVNYRQNIKAFYNKVYSSNVIYPSCVAKTSQPWLANSHNILYTKVTFGEKYVELYDIEKEKMTSLLLTENETYCNGMIIESKPSMLVIHPGVLFKYVIGKNGCKTVNVNTFCSYKEETSQDTYDESLTPFEVYKQNHSRYNVLQLYKLDKNTNDIESLCDYNDTEVPNATPFDKYKEDAIKRMSHMSVII